ncbi:Cationic amino acid transporter 1 [Colletotrichum siamense]|nr:Cationic amino acid transporter 1 [Colletotrichum siamense]
MEVKTQEDVEVGRHDNESTRKTSMVDIDHGADSQLQRRLGNRHITMIGIGSSIGMGLWLGSGKGLVAGGPASLFIGFIIASSMVWAVSQSIGEMAVMYPLPSAFVQWTNKFVDPAAGFALGWCYWFNYWIAVANELQGIVTVLSFWNTSVPKAAWISIFWVVIALINVGAVTVFAEVEVVMAAIKFGWIFVVIIASIVISAGGAPSHEAIGFRYWNEAPFLNGFRGFLTVMPVCIFALSGSETTGLVAAELSNPKKAVPKAVKSIALRLAMFYLMGSLMITITVSPSDSNLFGSGAHATDASPFVIAFRNAGLEPLAHMMNAVIFLSVLSSGSINAYAGSRTLVGLSEIGMAPSWMKKADRRGRPWYTLTPTLLIGGGLSYLNASHTGAEVFSWLSSLVSLFTLFGWSMICLSHIRMRHAWKVQGRSVNDLPWKTKTWPWAAYWGLIWCIILTIVQFYLAIWPFNGETSAKSFFSTYVSVPVGIIIYVAAKFFYGGRHWLDSRSIDLDSDRRFYSAEQEDEDKKVPFAKRILKKLLLQLINLLVLLPALVSAAHGDPRRMSYSGSCIIAKDGTWSPKCTTAYVEAALGSQCTNLGGTLSNINFQTTITQINYRCNCVHGNTKDFTFNDGVFEAKAVVGDKC